MRDRLRSFIAETFLFGERGVADDEPLFESGIIDSLGFMKLLAFVQDELGVALDMSEVTIENFATVDAMMRTIEAKRGGPGGEGFGKS